VFYLSHASGPPAVQEIITTVRSVGDIRRVFVYNALKAAIVRGTEQQISLAAWIVDQLNQPADVAAPGPPEYQWSGGEVARVFELAHAETPQDLQEIVTLIRSIGDVQRMFICNQRHAVVLRAPEERVALAAWLVDELDKPAGPQDTTAVHEYRQLSGPDNLVRVFYLAEKSPEERRQVIDQVRANAGVRRIFIYNALGALAVRGTVGQVETAEKVLEEMKVK